MLSTLAEINTVKSVAPNISPGPWAVTSAANGAITIHGSAETICGNGWQLRPADSALIEVASEMYTALAAILVAQYDGDPKRQAECQLCIAARTVLAKVR